MADKIKETTSDSAVLSPLYQTICGAMQSDGTLPPDFSLPRPEPEGAPRSIRFADGAFDGIALYHMAPDKRDIKSLTEVVGLLCAGACDKAAECLHLYFSMDEYISMLPLCDDLQQWILDHKDRIDATLLYNACICSGTAATLKASNLPCAVWNCSTPAVIRRCAIWCRCWP